MVTLQHGNNKIHDEVSKNDNAHNSFTNIFIVGKFLLIYAFFNDLMTNIYNGTF